MDFIKSNRNFWLYLIGIVLLFIILLIAGTIFLTREGITTVTDEDGQTNIPKTFGEVPEFRLDLDARYFATFNTSIGNFKVELFPNSAPGNVNSFVFLAQRRYYDGTTFFRVEPNVLIQGGSNLTLNENPEDDLLGNPGYVVKDEINWDSLDLSPAKRDTLKSLGYSSNYNLESLNMTKYSLVMANADKPNTAGSQFFIVFGDNFDPRLDYLEGRHTVIGNVTEGFDVVDQMRLIDVDTSTAPVLRPVIEVIVNSIVIEIQ